jgi:hypothetical protein
MLMTTIGIAPAYADDSASGEHFSLTLSGLQDKVVVGDTITGTLTLTTAPAKGRYQVHYEVLVSTPLGEAPVQSGTFRMTPGRTRTFPLSLPVTADVAPGIYQIELVVEIAGETLSVVHEFELVKNA